MRATLPVDELFGCQRERRPRHQRGHDVLQILDAARLAVGSRHARDLAAQQKIEPHDQFGTASAAGAAGLHRSDESQPAARSARSNRKAPQWNMPSAN